MQCYAYQGHVQTGAGPSYNAASASQPTSSYRTTSASSRALDTDTALAAVRLADGDAAHQTESQAPTPTAGYL